MSKQSNHCLHFKYRNKMRFLVVLPFLFCYVHSAPKLQTRVSSDYFQFEKEDQNRLPLVVLFKSFFFLILITTQLLKDDFLVNKL